ncbi:hypothetical protein D187_009750 [Cystobacter fuscus DSM 2262]|uniref:Uncharacterized protein n=2 Tax=Cystobacter fuscus TaxID=43 RepID=S9NVR9_CYSF2|nr:hypothetical protein D187_009750 [Cystobacter fuscus DSM 2262]
MGGAMGIRSFLDLLGPSGAGLRLSGLCDQAEAGDYCRGIERAGLGPCPDRRALEALGFGVCESDLEDELIRALGPAAVLDVVAAAGEAASPRRLQAQPAQRGRPLPQQLHRFFGSQGGRKERYATLLVEALAPSALPAPLLHALAGA